MATNKNITMKQYNGTDYDTLYPKTIAKQVDGVYSKEQVLSSATAALFGLTSAALPDDVLAEIGKYKQYWWRRRSRVGTQSKQNINSVVYLTSNTTANDKRFLYSKSVTLDMFGAVALDSPQDFFGFASNSSQVTDFNNDVLPSLQDTPYYIAAKTNPSVVYYVPQGALVTGNINNYTAYAVCLYQQSTSNRTVVLNNNSTDLVPQLVTNIVEIGDWQYIQSSNRNAYPDSGTQDGYEYEYLGVPFDNAVTAPKIETGSYVGTGTYGADNPNTLTFGFVPKLVIIQKDTDATTYLWGNLYMTVLVSSSIVSSNANVSGTTLSWYATNNQWQLNVANWKYTYLAIG